MTDTSQPPESTIRSLEHLQPQVHELTYNAPTSHTSNGARPNTASLSGVESAVLRRQQFEAEQDAITAIAYRLTSQTGNPYQLILHAITQTSATLEPEWPTMLATLEHIHTRWNTLINPTDTSEHLCPSCGGAYLTYRQSIYRCPACEYAATPSQLQTMTIYRITTMAGWVSREQACQFFTLPAGQPLTRSHLRVLIHRGQVRTQAGAVWAPDLLHILPRV